MKLTHELKEIALKVAKGINPDRSGEFELIVIKRFLDALPNSEPVGVFANVNALLPALGERWEHMVDDAYSPEDGYIYLYKAQPIPQDYKAQLAESQAREAQWREALRNQNFWVEGALHCKEWEWDADQRESAESCLAFSKETLAAPPDATALNELIAKAGEVMRERCSTRCGGGHNKLSGRLYAESIRALPGVTLEDLNHD